MWPPRDGRSRGHVDHDVARKWIRGTRPLKGWRTFLRNHTVWACDYLQVYDVWFRPIFAFFIVDVNAKRVVHVAVTRAPTQTWTAQQLRNATPFGHGPEFIIRDRDDKFGAAFDRVAKSAGTRVLRTAVQAPLMNAVCERFLGSVRRECLDHIVILSEAHLRRVLGEYARSYFNAARPHQGLGQRIPVASEHVRARSPVRSRPPLCLEDCTMTTAPQRDSNGRPKEPTQGARALCAPAYCRYARPMASSTDNILEMQGFFWKELRAAVWKEISNTGTSATFQDGRRVITVGNQGDDSLYWTAYPSVSDAHKVDPILGYMGSSEPVPVGAFDITGAAAMCAVLSNVLDKEGNFAPEPFCNGPMADVYARLLAESVRRIDEFIAGGESIN
jgi:transposase InsO family protein